MKHFKASTLTLVRFNAIVIIVALGCCSTSVEADEHSSQSLSLWGTSNFVQVNQNDVAELTEAGCPSLPLLPMLDLRNLGGQWTISHMSKKWISHLAKTLTQLGRTGNTLSDGMCIHMKIGPMPPGQSFNNAPIWVHSRCPKSKTDVNLGCKPSSRPGSPNALWFCNEISGNTTEADTHVAVVDTDNKNWVLLVKCFPNQGTNWALLTKERNIPDDLVDKVFKRIGDLGFDVNEHFRIPIQSCVIAI